MKHASIAACAALVSAVAVCWHSTLPYPFVYDDVMHVADNPHIRSLRNPLRFFLDPSTVAVTPTPATEVYRPLATLSHALTYAVFGLDPRGYRLVNIVLHAVNAMLLFVLVGALLPSVGRPGAFPWAGLLAALAWAVHPVNVESVTWIVGRSNILCGLFFLLALLCRTWGDRAPALHRWWRGGALAAFCLALLSKEHAIVLPLILIACDAAAVPRRAPGGRGYAAYFKVAACYCILRLALIGRMTQRGSWGGGLASHVALQVMGLATYLRLLVLPFRLRLDYVFDPPSAGGAAWFALSAAIVALFLGLITLAWKRRSPYLLGLLWIVIALLPVLNLLPIKAVVNERFLYLPAMGLSFLIAAGLASEGGGAASVRSNRGRCAAAAAVVVCLGLLTVRRNGAWESAFTLWGDTARKEPRSFIGQINFGKACNDLMRSELAVAAGTAALNAVPTCAEARAAAFHIRAVALMRLGRAGEAERDLRSALDLDRAPYLYATLAQVLILEGRQGEAEEMLRRAGLRPAGP